jgi:hypothetical protein
MNESAAREVTLLQAFEAAQPPVASWTEADQTWADRVAAEAAGTQAAPDEFIAQRARHAMQRLLPRERVAQRWLAQSLWRAQWLATVAVIAFFIGLLADSVGASQRINLLAPPLWGVLIWNIVVYLGLIAALLAAVLRRDINRAGPIVRGMQSLIRIGMRTGLRAPKAGPLSEFVQLWFQRTASLSALRAEMVLHLGAAALGLGLIAGLYARGLVLDYRAAWESTFLSPGVAHALVTGVLTPASRLSGIALPDATAFAALQAAQGDNITGAPAASWIHLLALTLLLFVVVPRLLIALGCVVRLRSSTRRFKMPLTDPYFHRMLRVQRGGAAQVQAWPYALTPSPQAVLGLRALMADALGAKVGLQIAPTITFGGEDDTPIAPADATTHAIAWFDLIATPEAESQGRFVQQLAAAMSAGASVIVLIDEAAFVRRFVNMPERLQQRREVWRAFCESLGTPPVFADLESSDGPPTTVSQAALQLAIARPVQARALSSDSVAT